MMCEDQRNWTDGKQIYDWYCFSLDQLNRTNYAKTLSTFPASDQIHTGTEVIRNPPVVNLLLET